MLDKYYRLRVLQVSDIKTLGFCLYNVYNRLSNSSSTGKHESGNSFMVDVA